MISRSDTHADALELFNSLPPIKRFVNRQLQSRVMPWAVDSVTQFTHTTVAFASSLLVSGRELVL